MRLINDAGHAAVHSAGETFTADDAGVFDLPDELGHHLLAFPDEGWAQADDDDQADDADEAPRPRRPRRRTS